MKSWQSKLNQVELCEERHNSQKTRKCLLPVRNWSVKKLGTWRAGFTILYGQSFWNFLDEYMDTTREKLKTIKKHVIDSFKKRMSEHGFDRYIGGKFYRNTEDGRVGIALFFGDQFNCLKIEAS